MVAFNIVQCHPGLTYICNFWHSATLVLRAERQSARMSEIKTVGFRARLNEGINYTRAKCNQLTTLPFKGLNRNESLCALTWGIDNF